METALSIMVVLQEGEYLSSINLSDAYLHIPICQEHRRYLRFSYGSSRYPYHSFPFRLGKSPKVFTKLLVVLMAHLQKKGIFLFPYLDDILIKVSSRQGAESSTWQTMCCLEEYGFVINHSKSSLVASQILKHLGVVFNAIIFQASLSLDHQA